MTKAAVIGAGSWGTAFAQVLVDAGTETTMLARRPEIAAAIARTGRNPDYLPDVELPSALRATADVAEALSGAHLVVLAVPSSTLRDNLKLLLEHLEQEVVLVSLMKGIEHGTTMRMSEVIIDVTGVTSEQVAVISGPNLAKEIAAR